MMKAEQCYTELQTAAHVALAASDNQRESVLRFYMVLTFFKDFFFNYF